jgi:hypothetical protein
MSVVGSDFRQGQAYYDGKPSLVGARMQLTRALRAEGLI